MVRLSQAELLAIGSLAPEFAPETYIRGNPISNLKRGQKYVIEFSGTECAPCIRCIPIIEALKGKYQQFRFISLFSEEEGVVIEFLKNEGEKMTTDVASDSTGSVGEVWLRQAGVEGIPFTFVVSDELRIAWMGSPEQLVTVLPMLAKGDALPPEEFMRVSLERHAGIRALRANQRWNEAQQYRRDPINKLVNKGLHAQALEAIDRGLEIYGDLPDVVDDLQTFKLYEMARVPGTRAAARRLAFDIAADYYNKNASDFASTLIQHYEVALPENKDKDFVLLALVLLKESRGPKHETDGDYQLTVRRNYYSSLAKAYHLLGQHKDAGRALRTAIFHAEKQVRDRRDSNAHTLNIVGAEKNLARLKKLLPTYDEQFVLEVPNTTE